MFSNLKPLLEKHNITSVNTFVFGSRAYGTERDTSDYDYIVVIEEKSYPQVGSKIEEGNTTIHLFTERDFGIMVGENDVRAMECIYFDGGHTDIDLGKMRRSFSTVANGAWIKGKKKLTVSADYDKIQAIKSIFHSVRIFDFGIQIVSNGNISEPARYKWLLDELFVLSEKYERKELWDKIYDKYHTIFKDVSSRFKQLAPKVKDINSGDKGKEDILEYVQGKIKSLQSAYEGCVVKEKRIATGGKLRGYKEVYNYIKQNLINV